nr:MAG TPA: hypothetical protein [Caudoviricetes sp.]
MVEPFAADTASPNSLLSCVIVCSNFPISFACSCIVARSLSTISG